MSHLYYVRKSNGQKHKRLALARGTGLVSKLGSAARLVIIDNLRTHLYSCLSTVRASLKVPVLVLLNFAVIQAKAETESWRQFAVTTQSELNSYLDQSAGLSQKSLGDSNRWAAAANPEFKRCQNDYNHMFSDGVLNFSFTVGYLDWPEQNYNLDQDTFNEVLQSLTRVCISSSPVCGFQVVETPYRSKTILEKFVPAYPGAPTANLKIRIALAHSSWAIQDSDNFDGSVVRPEQKITSQIAEEAFFNTIAGTPGSPGGAVEKCEICAYMGHARNGGGPDFKPVPQSWRKDSGEPEYSYYLAKRTNFRRLLSSLESSSEDPPTLVAILGCNSYKKFYTTASQACPVPGSDCEPKSLSSFSGETGFLLTNALSWPQNRHGYIGTLLDGVAGLRCRSTWQDRMNRINREFAEPEGYDIYGKFL
jgi:hypothetical protein